MTRVPYDDEWKRLHQQLREIATRRAALDAQEARCLREAHQMQLWRRFGYVHMNEYLERELGYGPQVGVERLRVALALAELPAIEATLGQGVLSYSAVRELTRVATSTTEQSWLDKARGKTLREIEQIVSGKKRGDRPEDPSNPDLTTRVLRLELSPPVFAIFRQVQSALANEHGGRLDESALIEVLCRRALESSESTAEHTERPAYQVAITVCDGCGRAWQNGAGREIEVGREIAERARCDAEEIGSLAAKEPARVRTTVTTRVRRQVLARDQHRCTVPGCRSARNLDLHHIEFQEKGGSHEIWNLTVVCSAHHQHLHEGRLTIRGRAPDALEFVWRKRSEENLRVPRADERPITDDRSSAVKAPDVSHSYLFLDTERTVEQARMIEKARPVEEAQMVERAPTIEAARQVETAAAVEDARRVDEDARLALVTAGYKTAEAREAVTRARPHVGAEATLEQVIRAALGQCARLRGSPRPS